MEPFFALNAASGSIIWQTNVGFEIFESSPAVANGVVYAGGQGFNLYVMDALTGHLLKTLTTGGPLGFSSPVVVNGKVYVGSFDKELHVWGLK